jgi:hypothetical protein
MDVLAFLSMRLECVARAVKRGLLSRRTYVAHQNFDTRDMREVTIMRYESSRTNVQGCRQLDRVWEL